jgi:hypothetical protein
MPLAHHTLTELYDGSFLLAGGITGTCFNPCLTFFAVAQAWTFVP